MYQYYIDIFVLNIQFHDKTSVSFIYPPVTQDHFYSINTVGDNMTFEEQHFYYFNNVGRVMEWSLYTLAENFKPANFHPGAFLEVIANFNLLSIY